MSQYASNDEFYDLSGFTQARLENCQRPIYPDVLAQFLRAASGLIDGAVAIKYKAGVPLPIVSDSVRLATVSLAAWYVGTRIGFRNDDERKSFADARDTWMVWLRGIREGSIFLDGLEQLPEKIDYRGPAFATADDGDLDDGEACHKGGRRNFYGHGCG